MECQDNYLTEIRQKSFIETNFNRTEKRNVSHNARRTDYENVQKRLQVPDLKEFEKVCKFFSNNKLHKDLERIHLGLSCGPEYINTFLSTSGAPFALIGCLSGINTKRQILALYCVINLGLGSTDERFIVCKKSGSYLISLLGSSDVMIQGLCCWAFGNLCERSEEICSFIQFQGFEEGVLKAILSKDPFVMQMGFYAFNFYFEMLPHRIKDVFKPSIIKEFVIDILYSSIDQEFMADFCWCLFIISTEPTICNYLVNYGIVTTSLKILYTMANDNCLNKRIITSLVRVLSNCVAVNNRVAIEICYNTNQFVPIVKFLMKSPYPHLHDEGMQLIANIVNGAMSQSVTGKNILEDSNFRKQIEPILQQILASRFYSLKPECQFVEYYL